jgi:transcription elongation factor Elf1
MSKNKAPTSYRHTIRLFGVLTILLVAAIVVRYLASPPTFGQHGFFRGAAVDEARANPPRYLSENACVDCHEEQVELHDKDAHATVECEACHGPGWKHAAEPEEHGVKVPEGKQPCLVCHRLLAARPGAFPQVQWREHYRFVGVEDEKTDCMQCHDPHEPLFMDRDLRTARLHPLIHRCRDCHIGRVNDKLPRPERHPAIFECSYCHKDMVEDFTSRAHHEVRCTTCHLFIKQSDFNGRIVRDADPRFCLLCHRDADFRSSDAPPGIDWPDHLEDVAEEPGDRDKRCIDCHRDRIHKPTEGQSDEP